MIELTILTEAASKTEGENKTAERTALKQGWLGAGYVSKVAPRLLRRRAIDGVDLTLGVGLPKSATRRSSSTGGLLMRGESGRWWSETGHDSDRSRHYFQETLLDSPKSRWRCTHPLSNRACSRCRLLEMGGQ